MGWIHTQPNKLHPLSSLYKPKNTGIYRYGSPLRQFNSSQVVHLSTTNLTATRSSSRTATGPPTESIRDLKSTNQNGTEAKEMKLPQPFNVHVSVSLVYTEGKAVGKTVS